VRRNSLVQRRFHVFHRNPGRAKGLAERIATAPRQKLVNCWDANI
jgi:hypothetical protein